MRSRSARLNPFAVWKARGCSHSSCLHASEGVSVGTAPEYVAGALYLKLGLLAGWQLSLMSASAGF